LPGYSAIWVQQHREWYKDLALEAMRRVCGAAVETGDYSGAIVWSRRMLEIEPWLEEAYRSLILCHARLEQRGRVKSWYELCVRRLREELEVDPEHATRLLFEQAMQGRLLASTDGRRST
jgi:DNA-binding SARP family transcriptional activator